MRDAADYDDIDRTRRLGLAPRHAAISRAKCPPNGHAVINGGRFNDSCQQAGSDWWIASEFELPCRGMWICCDADDTDVSGILSVSNHWLLTSVS